MKDKNIEVVFDDWNYRIEMVIKQRKQDYKLLFILVGIFTFITILGMFFSIYVILFFALWHLDLVELGVHL